MKSVLLTISLNAQTLLYTCCCRPWHCELTYQLIKTANPPNSTLRYTYRNKLEKDEQWSYDQWRRIEHFWKTHRHCYTHAALDRSKWTSIQTFFFNPPPRDPYRNTPAQPTYINLYTIYTYSPFVDNIFISVCVFFVLFCIIVYDGTLTLQTTSRLGSHSGPLLDKVFNTDLVLFTNGRFQTSCEVGWWREQPRNTHREVAGHSGNLNSLAKQPDWISSRRLRKTTTTTTKFDPRTSVGD